MYSVSRPCRWYKNILTHISVHILRSEKNMFVLENYLTHTIFGLDSKVICMCQDSYCNLHTILGNHCAKYEHPWSKNERGVVTNC